MSKYQPKMSRMVDEPCWSMAGASATNPDGYIPGMWVFSGLGFLALVFAFLLWRADKRPGSHRLDAVKK